MLLGHHLTAGTRLGRRLRRDRRIGIRNGKRNLSPDTAKRKITAEEEHENTGVANAIKQVITKLDLKIKELLRILGLVSEEKQSTVGLLHPVAADRKYVAALLLALALYIIAIADAAGIGEALVEILDLASRLQAYAVALVLSALLFFVAHALYRRSTPYERKRFFWVGMIILLLCVIGFGVLRTTNIMSQLAPTTTNDTVMFISYLLLFAGLSLGGPLSIGYLLDTAHEKLRIASVSYLLHRREQMLQRKLSRLEQKKSQLEDLLTDLHEQYLKRLQLRLAAYDSGHQTGLSVYGIRHEGMPAAAVSSP